MSDYKPNEAETLLIAALRSGEYKQGRNALRTLDMFCCLGVACDLYAKATGEGAWDLGAFAAGGDRHDASLVLPVQRWLGWRTCIGDTAASALSELNDQGRDFEELADIIERGEVLRAEEK